MFGMSPADAWQPLACRYHYRMFQHKIWNICSWMFLNVFGTQHVKRMSHAICFPSRIFPTYPRFALGTWRCRLTATFLFIQVIPFLPIISSSQRICVDSGASNSLGESLSMVYIGGSSYVDDVQKWQCVIAMFETVQADGSTPLINIKILVRFGGIQPWLGAYLILRHTQISHWLSSQYAITSVPTLPISALSPDYIPTMVGWYSLVRTQKYHQNHMSE